jgi:hypothetical protein
VCHRPKRRGRCLFTPLSPPMGGRQLFQKGWSRRPTA